MTEPTAKLMSGDRLPHIDPFPRWNFTPWNHHAVHSIPKMASMWDCRSSTQNFAIGSTERGFTLIEVLMALTVFALISALGYGALTTAGAGFDMLAEVRDGQERAGWIGRQLRADVAYISSSSFTGTASSSRPEKPRPLRIENDNRGESEFDELWLLVREPGREGISQIRYYLDEGRGHIMRESRLLWARDSVETQQWDMGEAGSWAVEAMDREGRWQQTWQAGPAAQGAIAWPRALRVRMKNETGEHRWLLPLLYGAGL